MVDSNIDISSFVKKSSSIGKQEADLLSADIKDYPWCSAYHLLLAKAHSNEKSFLFNKHLRLAATYIGERSLLFSLINNETQQPSLKKEHIDTVDVVETQEVDLKEELKEVASNKSETKTLKEEEIVFEKKEEKAAHTKVVLEEDKEQVLEQSTEVKSLEEAKDVEIREPSNKVDFEKIVVYDPLKELTPADPPKNERTELPFDTVVYNPEEELSKLIEEKEEKEEKGKADFLYWINHVDDEESTKESTQAEQVQNLLNQFLATKRSKPLTKREFYKAEVKVERSETDNLDVVSETLLDIYINQGLYEKAIIGFEKLSLQNPSKSAYFAARITQVKEIQKQSSK